MRCSLNERSDDGDLFDDRVLRGTHGVGNLMWQALALLALVALIGWIELDQDREFQKFFGEED